MQNTDEQLKKRFRELADRAEIRRSVTYSDFLTLDEQSILNSSGIKTPFVLYGGYPSAERRVACFNCNYENSAGEESPVRCVRIKPVAPKFADELSHRDFLGTLMGLGIRRETVGDIIIYENTGYVYCLPKIAEYISQNVDRVKHTSVKCEAVDSPPADSTALPEKQMIIVPSERLDAIVAAVYKLSRASSQTLFQEGRVFINGRQTNNTSYLARENDIVSVRGFGRFIFCGTAGKTKKERLKVNVRIF